MKINPLKLAVVVLAAWCSSVFATSTIDGGGLRAASANYATDNSIGGIGGTTGGPGDTNKTGYIGQLTEVVSIVITAMPSPVSEFSNAQLSATATLDDSTLLPLTGSDVDWSSSGIPYPFSGISAAGVAAATNVYQNTSSTINGYYLGTASNTTLLVLDAFPDDYGLYANDGIPDSWQAQYFGLNNSNAFPNADADGTGQNNLFKYVAGLDPTNPASIFVLRITPVAGQPAQKNLLYNPIAAGRTYVVQVNTNLHGGVYTTLASFSGPTTNSTQAAVTDLAATKTNEFYRVRISYP